MKRRAVRRRLGAWLGLACLGLVALPSAAQQPTLRATLRGHAGSVIAVAFSPDGKQLASGGGELAAPGEIKLWDVPTGKERAALKGHPSQVECLAFSPDGGTLASGSFRM